LAQADVADFSKQVELALFFDAKLDIATHGYAATREAAMEAFARAGGGND